MDFLPDPDERAWLLDELAGLICRRGHSTFVSTPVLEPIPAHFPDAWTPDASGVRRLLRRLLSYADLGQLRVDVELYTNALSPTSEAHDAAAWFAGIEAGRCRFGVDEAQLGQPDALVGALAHEVAHAYRHHHGLQVDDRALEEKLTDLTTVYLGFGVLTTNAAYRYRQQGDFNGSYATLSWSHQRLGYLSPPAMSFLVAAQQVVRAPTAAERRRFVGLLEPTQAACFKEAYELLAGQDLVGALRLPRSLTWAAPRQAIPVPLVDDEPVVEPRPRLVEATPGRNDGLPVFRVRRDFARHYFMAFGVLGLVGAGALFAFHQIGMTGFLLLLFFVTGLGGFLGGRRGYDRCSEPECEWRMPEGITRCLGCGGAIAGRIQHANERLDAREALGRN